MRNEIGLPLRFAAFAAVTVAPFWHFLVQNQFSLFRSESVAATLLFCVPAEILAGLARGRAFLPVLISCAVVVSTYPLRADLAPIVSLSPWLAACISAALLSGIALALGRNFPALLIVFTLSFLAADFLRPLTEIMTETSRARESGESGHPGHLIYIVLDGEIGIDGFPTGIESCSRARNAMHATLRAHDFTVYPGAFSNYTNTLVSIPSILNRRLPSSEQEFSSQRTREGAVVIAPNQLFQDYRDKGYEIVVYQHRSIDYAAGVPDVDRVVEYTDLLSGLEYVPGWRSRFWWIVGDYQGSDPLLSMARAFLPFRLRYRKTGPLAVRSIWPGPLAEDIAHSTEKTLFFVHLLIPHEPYVYRADGSVREVSEWADDHPIPPVDRTTYQSRYELYCDQVESLARQLTTFLEDLRSEASLDAATIVIHGDHSSRLRLRREDAAPDEQSEQQDRRDQFSALLAIKKPGAQASRDVPGSRSVLSYLLMDFYGESAGGPPGADHVYRFDDGGFPIEAPGHPAMGSN